MPTGAQFNVAVPYPGSELYKIAVDKGWIQKEVDWRQMYQHGAIMKTDELTNADLNFARKKAYKALYTNPKWWLQNIEYTFRHPSDFNLATRYSVKILKNFAFNKMTHSH